MPLFAAEQEEPKIGIWGKWLIFFYVSLLQWFLDIYIMQCNFNVTNTRKT